MQGRIIEDLKTAAHELLSVARLKENDIFILGCSSSEVMGEKIGTGFHGDIAKDIFIALYDILNGQGVFLASQCCEHLNRSIVLDRSAADYYRLTEVNAVPHLHGGGALAAAAYSSLSSPVLVESVTAKAGMDIGDTLIGMHLVAVAVPVRVSIKKIGEANLVCARTRPKSIGGERARYDETLL